MLQSLLATQEELNANFEHKIELDIFNKNNYSGNFDHIP